MGWELVNCIHLAQVRDKWLPFVHTVINLLIPLTAGNLLTSRRPYSFSSRICSINHASSLDCRSMGSQIEGELGSLLREGG